MSERGLRAGPHPADDESWALELDAGPRWYVSVRFPASQLDRRAVLGIPAAFFTEPVPVPSVELWLDPRDPDVARAFDALNESLKVADGPPLLLQLGAAELRLERIMQAELHSGLMALLVASACDSPVETRRPSTAP
ncbi:MAG TPA: hypothetical protein VMU00_08355 [Steroidobacteraceae bacterium]|nr:hypothetical protein [Steroidobacteraceae bacterium]